MSFVFDGYDFDFETGLLQLRYGFSDGRRFVERVQFRLGREMSEERRQVLERALWLAFMVAGVSYYKTFPVREVEVGRELDEFSAEFLNHVYHEGLGQFAYENGLLRGDLAVFYGRGEERTAVVYDGRGDLLPQSGGKDSLLLACWLEKIGVEFTPCIVSSGGHYPKLLDELREPVVVIERKLDGEALRQAAEDGGLNGHVPVTYIMMSYGLIQAILLGKNRISVGVGHEGAEENTRLLDGMEVNHQWSKSWEAEMLFARYVREYVSPDIMIGSPLRGFSELLIAKLFVREGWERFGRRFSSCNVANYRQQVDNSEMKWCGDCPKCANSYLMFAPFLKGEELRALFGGQELFAKESLRHAFAGLLGVDGVMKPFECVGEVDELRRAYHLAMASGEYDELPFVVPSSTYNYWKEYEAQDWAREMTKGLRGENV